MFKKTIVFSLSLILATGAFALDRKGRIQTPQELNEEIKYLLDNFDESTPDTLIRLFDYANRNAERKGEIINTIVIFPIGVLNQKRKTERAVWIQRFLEENIVTLKTTKLPRNGTWSRQAGNSLFTVTGNTKLYSSDEILAATQGKKIEFKEGYPDFSPFRINVIGIPDLSGQYSYDYPKILEFIVKNGIIVADEFFSSTEELQAFLKDMDLGIHYSLDSSGVDIIPNSVYSIIDYEMPYIKNR